MPHDFLILNSLLFFHSLIYFFTFFVHFLGMISSFRDDHILLLGSTSNPNFIYTLPLIDFPLDFSLNNPEMVAQIEPGVALGTLVIEFVPMMFPRRALLQLLEILFGDFGLGDTVRAPQLAELGLDQLQVVVHQRQLLDTYVLLLHHLPVNAEDVRG